VHQLEILPEPPLQRGTDNPWPTWPVILRSSAAHEEGGERLFAVSTAEFRDDGTGAVAELLVDHVVRQGPGFEAVPGSRFSLRADLVLLALGFVGPEEDLVRALGAEMSPRAHIAVDGTYMTTAPGVFACGDAVRGQSLIVWAIAEGRSAAAAVDRYLSGSTDLPAPLRPGTYALA
jgi:glutamate synthase (NADPH/NADH) small chain